MADINSASKYFLGLTGTLVNGYASGLFYILYRTLPQLMKAEKFEYGHAITYKYYNSNPIDLKPKSDTDSVIGAPYKKGWTRVICNMYTNSEHAFITYMDMSSDPGRITITITNTSNSSVQIEYFIGILYIKDTIINEQN